MKLVKFLFFICLILLGWYAWNHYLKDTEPAVEFLKIVMPKVEPSNVAKPEIEVSAAGFKKVPWIEGVGDNEVLVLGPT
jgi:hypothetical protein